MSNVTLPVDRHGQYQYLEWVVDNDTSWQVDIPIIRHH